MRGNEYDQGAQLFIFWGKTRRIITISNNPVALIITVNPEVGVINEPITLRLRVGELHLTTKF